MMSKTILTGRRELQLTLALLKPTLCSYPPDVSAVLRQIKRKNLEIVRTRRLFWTTDEAASFYAKHTNNFYFSRLVAGMTR